MNPLISVIIPAYNKGDLIKETIESVLLQTYSNYEIIIVDDGSTDNTADTANSIKDDRIKYYYQPNSGLPARPRNKGVALSNGEYIAFLDHDDLWMNQKLEKQISIIGKDNSIALVSTNAYFIIEDKKTKTPLIKDLKSGYFNENDFLPEIKVIQSTVLMKKSVFIEMNGFNESFDLKAREDYDLWLRMFSKYTCYYINECLAYYRKSVSSTSGGELHFIETSLMHYNKYFAKYGFSEKINKIKLSSILHHLSCVQYLSGDKRYLYNARKAYRCAGGLRYLLFYLYFMLPRTPAIGAYRFKQYLNKVIFDIRHRHNR